MAIYLNTNIVSMMAQQNLSNSQTQMATAIQQLSSGLQINSAKDNAAGYAIATVMGSQLGGYAQATRNANDAISLAQTAGGAMQSIINNLQTMRGLAVQSANATYSNANRASMNAEVQQLSSEIQRVALSTKFNGVSLLDGTFTAQNFQIGANNTANSVIQLSGISSMQTSQLGSAGNSYQSTVNGVNTTTQLSAGSLTLNGIQVGASVAGAGAGESAASAYSIANAINAVTAQSGVTATANATVDTAGIGATTALATGVAAGSFSINGILVGAIAAGGNAAGQGANVAAAINAVSAQSGVTATADATTGAVTLTAAGGQDINITPSATYSAVALATDTGLTAATNTATGTAVTANTSQSSVVNGVTVTAAAAGSGTTAAQQAAAFVTAFNTAATTDTALAGITASSNSSGVITLTSSGTAMTFGAQSNTNLATGTVSAVHGTVTLSSNSSIGIVLSGGGTAYGGFTAGTTAASITSGVNSIAAMNVSTQTNAQQAITTIDGAINTVLQAQGLLGAIQNRLTSVVSNLATSTQNLTAAQSQIQSTDFAAVTATLTRTQILQQAGTAMLAQANAMPNAVLTLLK
ncbi:flagellin [Ferrovum sp.]|uniref:flagellin N-terminal helical domain-containing protein n=1 Tax=Ferrovum sp. TaxID=2609467 RepID=UPI002631BFAD|nr:flagellin [Ferrovum sp.]